MLNRFLKHTLTYKWKYFSIIIFIIFWNSIDFPLFKDPTSTIVMTKKGELLAARIADDEQWRFPQSNSIPEKFAVAITHFEDEYFYYHIGVNPVSFFRAIWQNLKAGKIVSGASTLLCRPLDFHVKVKIATILKSLLRFF